MINICGATGSRRTLVIAYLGRGTRPPDSGLALDMPELLGSVVTVAAVTVLLGIKYVPLEAWAFIIAMTESSAPVVAAFMLTMVE